MTLMMWAFAGLALLMLVLNAIIRVLLANSRVDLLGTLLATSTVALAATALGLGQPLAPAVSATSAATLTVVLLVGLFLLVLERRASAAPPAARQGALLMVTSVLALGILGAEAISVTSVLPIGQSGGPVTTPTRTEFALNARQQSVVLAPTLTATPQPTAIPVPTAIIVDAARAKEPAFLGSGATTETAPNSTPASAPQIISAMCQVVLGVNLNVRAAPSAEASILMTRPFGSVVTLVQRTTDGLWWQSSDEPTGWLSGEFLATDANPTCARVAVAP